MNELFDKSRAARDARSITIRGAREHNLKNIDVTIPRDQLVVFTGLSGSGKSSLAFDTIYAEGQRRYVESLSAYARQFLEMMQKPDVDQIDGLSPAISIEQKTTSKNPRSTVGTVTEIYDYMRLLWARIGVPYSPATGLPIESQTISQMVDRVMALPEGTRIYVLAPVVRGRKGEYKKELADFMRKGYQRVKIDGAFYEIADVKPLDKKFTHDIDVVVDRLVVRGDIGTRLADSLEQCLKLADGLAVVELADSAASGAKANKGRNETAERLIFSEKFACPVSGFTISEIEPRLFSFNNPFGACPECGGLGVEQHIDADLVIPDRDATLRKGAIAPWAKSSSPYYTQTLEALAKHYRFTLDTKWKDLGKKTQEAILYGSGDDEIKFVYDDGMRGYTTKKPFEGVITNLERRFKETESEWAREDLQKYFNDVPCALCHGARLKAEALCVKIAGHNISQVAELSVRKAGEWFTELPKHLTDKQNEIGVRVLKEIRDRLRFLVDVGLDYLTLARASGTLSGGESQRIRLASQIGSGLTGVLYVLDEPSIGLHQRDNARLLETLKRLRDLGNTVIVVEHDEDAIRLADYVLDIGPGAGIHGGKLIAQGKVADLIAAPESWTGKYLSGELSVAVPERRRPDPRRQLRVVNARGNNLKNVTAEIPLGLFTCVTGVSGGGKSTLLIDTLYNSVARKLNGASLAPAPHDRIEGLEHIDKIIDIDQSPIGR
ncbi:MAG TPA: excinuclease ABC subunit UvrA, partial [Pseudolabrys sp.]